MTAILYEANYHSSDIQLVDNELAPGQILRKEPPLALYVGNGCEDGMVHLTRDMAIELRNVLARWLEAYDR